MSILYNTAKQDKQSVKLPPPKLLRIISKRPRWCGSPAMTVGRKFCRAGVIAFVVMILSLVGCRADPPNYVSHAPAPFNVEEIDAGLSSGQPYSISVLGDSTGNGPDEWVHLLAQRIAHAYNRRVEVRDWNLDTNSYAKTTSYGTGPPVTFFNASGSGKSARWSIDNFSAMVPEAVNFTLISHGHNASQQAVEDIGRLVDMAYSRGTGGVAVILQNPTVDDPVRQGLEADVRRKALVAFRDPKRGALLVDVFGAFPTDETLRRRLLNQDGIHPNSEGQQLWTETVRSQLHLR